MKQLRTVLTSAWSLTSELPLSDLDTALANFLHAQQPSADVRHLWLAALTSHQWGHGHACLDLERLRNDATQLLGWSPQETAQLPPDLADAASTLPWTQGDHSPMVWQASPDGAGGRLYLRRAWVAEHTIRQQIALRLAQPSAEPADLQTQLDALFPDSANAAHADMQRQACALAARHPITLITGGPGTGKTTTVVRLLALLVGAAQAQGRDNLRIHLAAPTGKAAARLSESISKALRQLPSHLQSAIPTHTQTLHRLLQVNAYKEAPTQLVADVMVVDEASMVDLEMMARLLRALPLHARLILLGDKDQLASVEAGAVMSQLCTGPLLREQTVTLQHSHRFKQDSGIGQWAAAVNAGKVHDIQSLWQAAPGWLEPGQTSHDVTRLQLKHSNNQVLGPAFREGWRNWLALLRAHPQGQACDDAQALALLRAFAQFCVLCAVREGPWGVGPFNQHIERALSLPQQTWYIGRPVMVTRNNPHLELMNGDLGLCLPGPDHVLRVAFAHPQGGVRWVAPSRLDAVETAFAMTVHKSQGSEFEHVLLVLPAKDVTVLSRELIYTGLTRASHKLTLWAPDTQVLWDACARRVLRSGGLGD